MYTSQRVIQDVRNDARRTKRAEAVIVRKHAQAFRRRGVPLPDAIAAKYPLIVSNLGDPYPELGLSLPGLMAPKAPSFGSQLVTAGISSIPGGGIAKSLIGGIGGVLGIGARDKNPGRLASNLDAYNRAIAGDAAGLDFLRVHSVPGAWATAVAVNDAAQKYAQAKSILANRVPGVAAKPYVPPAIKPPTLVATPASGAQGQSILDWLKQQGNKAVDSIQGQAPGGYAPAPQQAPVYEQPPVGDGSAKGAGISPLMIGAGLVGLYFLTQGGGSRRW